MSYDLLLVPNTIVYIAIGDTHIYGRVGGIKLANPPGGKCPTKK
jgi:hypothetical protein